MTNVWPFASYSFPENGRVTAIASALHKKKRLISAMPTSVANRVIKLPIPPYINVIHNINNEGSKALRSINPSRKVLDDCSGGFSIFGFEVVSLILMKQLCTIMHIKKNCEVICLHKP